jgi:hypothetical protein
MKSTISYCTHKERLIGLTLRNPISNWFLQNNLGWRSL